MNRFRLLMAHNSRLDNLFLTIPTQPTDTILEKLAHHNAFI